jgi:hypothetical protein
MTFANTETPSFAGRLGEFRLPELLQFLALGLKSGRLSLNRRDGQGVVLLRRGRIIYAASNAVRERFGNILVWRGLIDEATLLAALERQKKMSAETRLGTILIEMGKVRQADLEDVMRQQTSAVLSDLCQWTSGFFRFEAIEIAPRGEIEVDAREFLALQGFPVDHVLLEAMVTTDEGARALPPGAEPVLTEPPEPTTLEELVSPLPAPALRGELTLEVMRFAASLLHRGLLFLVRGERLYAIGQFGLGEVLGADPAAIRAIQFPIGEPSVLSDVVQRRQAFRGPLTAGPGNDRLLKALGGVRPLEVAALPLCVGDSVTMVLYGDRAPEEGHLPDLANLETLLNEVGLGIEKDALEEKIAAFQKHKRH